MGFVTQVKHRVSLTGGIDLTVSSERFGSQAACTSYPHVLYRKSMVSCVPTWKKNKQSNYPAQSSTIPLSFQMRFTAHLWSPNHSCLMAWWPLLPPPSSSSGSTWSSLSLAAAFSSGCSQESVSGEGPVVCSTQPLIQVCTYLDCFFCSRSVVFRPSTSGHRPVTGQARYS